MKAREIEQKERKKASWMGRRVKIHRERCINKYTYRKRKEEKESNKFREREREVKIKKTEKN